MPMIPGPLAGAIYVSIKAAAYAGCATGMNAAFGGRVRPWKFAAWRMGFGLVCGLAGLFAMASLFSPDTSEHLLVLPGRVLAWVLAIAVFYGWTEARVAKTFAVIIGTLLSSALDGGMAWLYDIPSIQSLPGMQLGFC